MAEDMKNYELELVSLERIGEDYFIFDFKYPHGLVFEEGQYGMFSHVDRVINDRNIRVFSIASSRNEPTLKIATKITETPSDFKKNMAELIPGDTMKFTGPSGRFTLNKEFDAVFIAGGIGITPIRGLLKHCEEIGLTIKNDLVYSEPREQYPFKDEFDAYAFVTKHYRNDIEGTKDIIDTLSNRIQNYAYYYISGSAGFISSIKAQLIENGILETHIKFDQFSGYTELM